MDAIPTVAEIAALDRRFGIPGIAQVTAGNGGLTKVSITAPAATGEVYLHGAHVTAWSPKTQPVGAVEVLFVSDQSRWDQSHAIRGGVPICFPWFGNNADDPKAPAHGFVRAKAWQLESVTQSGQGDSNAVTVSLFTEGDAESKSLWPADFRLTLHATFGAELTLELLLNNTGAAPLRFEAALHSYFRVGDVQQARVRGLEGVQYLDKTRHNQQKTQRGDLRLTEETDSVYCNTSHALELEDPALRRRLHITKENSLSTVVWNPWAEKAKAMADLGAAAWKHMLCIECCNVGDFAVALAPGRQHSMRTTVSVAGL
jgi:glucose-6-phosphate 1-epimerase